MINDTVFANYVNIECHVSKIRPIVARSALAMNIVGYISNDNAHKIFRFEWIFMLCVGSGIAPLYTIANSIIKNEQDETRVQVIAGFKSLKHIPLLGELRKMSDFWNFSCTLYLSDYSEYKLFEN